MIQERLLVTPLQDAAVVPDEAGSFGCVDARAVELLRRLESERPTTYGADLASFLHRTIGNVESVVVELRQPEHALRFEAPVRPAFAGIRIRQARQVVVQVDDADEGRGVITLNMGHRSANATAAERLIRLCAIAIRAGLERYDAREARDRFNETFYGLPVGLAHVSADGSFLLVNDQFCRIAGHSRTDLMKGGFQSITHPDDLAIDLAYLHDLLAGRANKYTIEKRYIRANKDVIWINLTVSIVRFDDPGRQYFIAVIEDVSEVRRARREATHDPLTSLLNRRGMAVRGNRALSLAADRQCAVTAVYLDLDGFKAINDLRGHAEGDRILALTAGILLRGTKASDVVARMGGDEIVIILPDCSAEQGQAVVDALKHQLSTTTEASGGIQATFGLATTAPGSEYDLDKLLASADADMLSKKCGIRRR